MSFNQALKRIIGRLPPKGWVDNITPKFTPDCSELESQGFHLMFVSDEMMVGHRKHSELLNEFSACMCAAFTRDHYSNILHKLGTESYSISLEEKIEGIKQVPIKGEIFSVFSPQIKNLDTYKTNGQEFTRKRIKLYIPNLKLLQGEGETTIIPEEEVSVCEAWAYIGNYSFFYPFLDAGYSYCPVNIYKDHRPWLGEFSYFSDEEYKKR